MKPGVHEIGMRRIKYLYGEGLFPADWMVTGHYRAVLKLEAGHQYVFRHEERSGRQYSWCMDRTTGKKVWDDPPSRDWDSPEIPSEALVQK